VNNNSDPIALEQLTIEYCRHRGLNYERPRRYGENKVNYLIPNGSENESIGVLIKDWKRAVGVDIIIRAEQVMKASRYINKMLIISNVFSDPARSLAEKIGIFLLTRNDLLKILSSDLSQALTEKQENRENVLLY